MTFSTTTTPLNPDPKTEKNQTTRTSRTKSTTMPVPAPAGALTEAFRQLCMRCVRAKARVKDSAAAYDCVWSLESSKCNYCIRQHAPCVPFLGDEYQAIVDAETSSNPNPAAIKAAAAEAGRVATLADSGLLLTEQTCASSLLEGVAAGVKEVEKAVGKLPVAVAAASRVGGKKRKRGEGKEEEEEEERDIAADFG
ncbi:hypothetical protein V500_02985 [Pseudogymnoascus sp. VKM F-4518 (FW-2643)]|nr:hypothetical protein V500_02985 [Pseudogymnoascus sp. VKM F-4518 (FW-2643)]